MSRCESPRVLWMAGVRRRGLSAVSMLGVTMVVPMFLYAADGDAEGGRRIYKTNCLHCHGPEGKGDGQFGKTTSPPAADFTSVASRKKTELQLLTTIENGRPPTAMEAWKGQLSDNEIQDVLAYVITLRERR